MLARRDLFNRFLNANSDELYGQVGLLFKMPKVVLESRNFDLLVGTIVLIFLDERMLYNLELGRGRGISNLDKKARITRPEPLI